MAPWQLNYFFQVTALFLGSLRLWKEIPEKSTVGITLMSGQFGQHILEILIYVQVVCFCSFNQAVHDGTCLGTTSKIHANTILPTQSKRADGTFCQIIAHGDIPIGQKDPEIIFLIKTVLQCLVGVAFGRNLLNRFFTNAK